MASDFNAAVGLIGSYAGGQFDAAHSKLTTPPLNQPVTSLSPEQKKEIQSWQGQMAAAFAQLGDAKKEASQQTGYDDVVALMKTTAATAASICTKIGTVMAALPTVGASQAAIDFEAHQLKQIDALRAVLGELAALSPAAVWVPPAASGSKG
jgi:hypothetical protein